MENIKKWLSNNEKALFFGLVVLFILIRLPGTDLPLHQDEYKWPMIVNPALPSETEIPHPPLSQFIYRTAGSIVGFNENFRFVPLFFGTVNLFLLYYLVRFVYGRREAIIASFIWTFSYFSVLASLMVDTDGQIMPFFFLLSLISYFKLLNSEGKRRKLWGLSLVVFCVLGFLIKVSFILAILAIAFDFLWSKKHFFSRAQILKYMSFLIFGALGLVLLLFLTQYVFPFFDLSKSFTYWKHFFVADRGWFQTLIQFTKAVLFSSPFLILIPLVGGKNGFSKTKIFSIFIFISLIFYLVLFDFSIGALDRYLQLLILPLTVIVSIVITNVFQGDERRFREFFYLGLVFSLVFILLQSLSHFVPALHPKADWINRAISLRWNFLYPFSGGSGPLGFYVSFLFIMLSWVVTFVAVIFAKFKTDYRKLVLIFLIPIGFTYNLIFIEEYLFGYFNGSTPKILNNVVEYIKNNPEIKMVTVYNDNGGNEIQAIGKYRKRLYVDPKFDITEKIENLNKYKEHYLVINVPRIDPTSIYVKYFNSCLVDYNVTDKYISATVYDCTKAPDVSL